ncbi:MAG: hypothetical protein IPG80_14315 [Anaerolineales bacterium]|uniref:hypothetical protein n=1 Tax=Candidatus Villigracilis vicinus TaxID=3140679 RepID=UPI003134E7D9|nr:hypothetical protein [Anaerolineales bacterium]
MRTRSGYIAWLGIFLFILGISMGLSLSAAMTWGEIETNLIATPTDSKSLSLSCPWMIAPGETSTIKTEIINDLEQEIEPMVIAEFGQPNTPAQKRESKIYILSPRETQPLQWRVDDSYAAFGRVIPVLIIQSRFNLNSPRTGACGILLFSIFGLSGLQTLICIIICSLICIAVGTILSRPYFSTTDEHIKKFAQIGRLLAIITVAALAIALLRWWGLTTLLLTICAITIGTAVTELLVPSNRSRS